MMEVIVESGACRDVTDDEIEHYRANGWAILPSFAPRTTTDALLEIAIQRMGQDGDSNPLIGEALSFFNPEFGAGLDDPLMRPLIDSFGRNAARLMERRADMGIRYFTDLFLPKLPSARKVRRSGNGATSFHQDFISWSLDRSGGMTFWVALCDLTADAGTMSFLSGSHRMGTLGNFRNYKGGDALDAYPDLRDTGPVSAPMAYRAGCGSESD